MKLGIAAADEQSIDHIRGFLASAGLVDLYDIRHQYDAAMIRREGGLVIHVERSQRPNFDANVTSGRIVCEPGDFVLENAVDPGEYLPRLLTKLTRLGVC